MSIVERRQQQIEREIEQMKAQIEEAALRLAEPGDGTGDRVDRVSEQIARAFSLTRYHNLVAKRCQLEHARNRLLRGLGGVCETCGRPIDPARLRAVIGATRCCACQRLTEPRVDRLRRHLFVSALN